jgi:hypothetical protein
MKYHLGCTVLKLKVYIYIVSSHKLWYMLLGTECIFLSQVSNLGVLENRILRKTFVCSREECDNGGKIPVICTPHQMSC